jgi:hypothetical protein
MAAYNCSRILADGSSCFGQITSSGGCDPCDARVEGGEISKTRGVPSQGSLRYGPRGQRQSFRRFAGAEDSSLGKMSSTKYLTGLLSVGVLFFIVGYGLQKGRLTA